MSDGQVQLTEIVDVQITRDTLALSRVGFGTALILAPGFTDTTGEVVKQYGSLSEVLDDFASDTAIYHAAAAYFGQTNKPARLAIGEYGSADSIGSIESVRAIDDDWYALAVIDPDGDIDGDTWVDRMIGIAEYIEANERIFGIVSFEDIAASTTVGSDTTSLPARLKALGYDRTFTIWDSQIAVETEITPSSLTIATDPIAEDTTTLLTATLTTGLIPGRVCRIRVSGLKPVPGALLYDTLYDVTNDEPIAGESSGVAWTSPSSTNGEAFTQDLYFLVPVGCEEVDIEITVTNGSGDPTDMETEFTATMLGDASDITPVAAWLGLMLPTDPGAASWCHKKLTGVTPSSLTATKRDNLFDKKVNVYSSIEGRGVTRWGTMAGGEYIDIIHGIDWLTQRIRERMARKLFTQPKVPFTDAGFAVIENELRAQLITAQAVGLIAPDTAETPGFVTSVPRVYATDIADRAERHARGIEFEARLAGAVHKVTIRGAVAP